MVLCLGAKRFLHLLWFQIQGVFLSLALVQGQESSHPLGSQALVHKLPGFRDFLETQKTMVWLVRWLRCIIPGLFELPHFLIISYFNLVGLATAPPSPNT